MFFTCLGYPTDLRNLLDISIISDISILKALIIYNLMLYCIISLYKFTFKFTTSHELLLSLLGRLPGLRYVSGIEPKIKICYFNDRFLWLLPMILKLKYHLWRTYSCLSECCCKPHLMDIHGFVHVVFLQLFFILCTSVFFMF